MKYLMRFIEHLDNRGLLFIDPKKYDYEKVVFDFENIEQPKPVNIPTDLASMNQEIIKNMEK